MIIGPAGFMHAPKADNLPEPPPYRLSELYVGQQLVIRVGRGVETAVEITEIVNQPDTINGFYWKGLRGKGKGWAYVDQILV